MAPVALTAAAHQRCAVCGHGAIRHYPPPHPGCAHLIYQPPLPGFPDTAGTEHRCTCPGWSDPEEGD